MNIETLNQWGESFFRFAWPMFWQSSLLMAIVFALDILLARKLRAAVRHALWVVVLLKLVAPPALALPTGAAWWLWPAKPAPTPIFKNTIVTLDASAPLMNFVPESIPMAPPPKLSAEGVAMLASMVVSVGLLSWLLFRWSRVARKIRYSSVPENLAEILDEPRKLSGVRRCPRLRLIDDAQSPAVYGLFRPVILLPRALAEKLSDTQLRAVLLHEAIHVRRGDVWIHFAQSLLQIVYWWHPLLWLANARMRRLREEAVDDAVMLALREDAEAYAPTLLEVAKFAVSRPLASLGLVGILESRSALRRRIERLTDFRAPRRAGLTFLSLLGIIAFSAIALPMGQAPASGEKQDLESNGISPNQVEAVAAKTTNQFAAFQPIQASNAMALSNVLAAINADAKLYVLLNRLHDVVSETNEMWQPNPPAFTAAVVNELNREISFRVNGIKDSLRISAQAQEDEAFAMAISNQLQEIETEIAANPDPMKVPREAMLRKIHQIRLENVYYRNLPLSKVIDDLCERSMIKDPDGVGIGFAFRPYAINPITGLPAETPANRLPLASQIKINLTLKNVSLADVFNAICLASDYPLTYSFDNYGVVFSEKDTNTPQYEMRTFKVGTNVFLARLSEQGKTEAEISSNLKDLFEKAGLDLSPPKTVWFNEKLGGVLFVYATENDLTVVERIVERLHDPRFNGDVLTEMRRVPIVSSDRASTDSRNMASDPLTAMPPYYLAKPGTPTDTRNATPSAVLEIRTYPVDYNGFIAAVYKTTGQTNWIAGFKELASKAGVDWSPSKFCFLEGMNLLFVYATKKDLDALEPVIANLHCPPPQVHIKARFIAVPKAFLADQREWFAAGLTNGGVLTADEMKSFLHRIGSEKDAVLLATPEGVIISGRRMQLQAAECDPVLINPGSSNRKVGYVENGPVFYAQPIILPGNQKVLYMMAKASVLEWFGYPGLTNAPCHFSTNAAGEKIIEPNTLHPIPLNPGYTQKTVSDGQTLVLFPKTEELLFCNSHEKPQVTEFIRQNEKNYKDTVMVALVTTTIIDAAGDRINSDDALHNRHRLPQSIMPPKTGLPDYYDEGGVP